MRLSEAERPTPAYQCTDSGGGKPLLDRNLLSTISPCVFFRKDLNASRASYIHDLWGPCGIHRLRPIKHRAPAPAARSGPLLGGLSRAGESSIKMNQDGDRASPRSAMCDPVRPLKLDAYRL